MIRVSNAMHTGASPHFGSGHKPHHHREMKLVGSHHAHQHQTPNGNQHHRNTLGGVAGTQHVLSLTNNSSRRNHQQHPQQLFKSHAGIVQPSLSPLHSRPQVKNDNVNNNRQRNSPNPRVHHNSGGNNNINTNNNRLSPRGLPTVPIHSTSHFAASKFCTTPEPIELPEPPKHWLALKQLQPLSVTPPQSQPRFSLAMLIAAMQSAPVFPDLSHDSAVLYSQVDTGPQTIKIGS